MTTLSSSSTCSPLFACHFTRIDNTFFRHISHVPQTRGWEKKIAEGPPCVVLASPGFMQNGPSRELFDLWAPDSRNGLIVTGYSIEGTLARVSGSSGLVHFGECLPVVVHSCIYSVQQWTIFLSLSSIGGLQKSILVVDSLSFDHLFFLC